MSCALRLKRSERRGFSVAALLTLIAQSMLRRRRLCSPAAALAALENFGPRSLRYSPRQLALRPIVLSSRRQVARDAPVRDSVSSWVSSHPLLTPETSFELMQSRAPPIFSQLSTLLPIAPAAVFVLNWPISLNLLAAVSRVAGSSSLTSSAS